jgi:hypothetical protein
MTKKALLVGINYLNDPSVKLNGCISDIVNISKTLVDNYGYTKENIVQLRDDVNDIKSMPTRQNILKELTNIINQSNTLSEIWFHYSGHGSQINDRTNDEKDRLDEVLVPSDFRTSGFIIDDEIFNIVKNTKCKTILLFDSCHSATVCDLQWSFEYNFNGSFIKNQNNMKKIDNPYVFSISGCKDIQTSVDSYSVEQKEAVGAFTDAFIHCLKSNNYNVNLIKLYADTCSYLRQTGYSQKPILSCSSMIPSYIFIKTVLPLPTVVSPVVSSSPLVVKVPTPVNNTVHTNLKDNIIFTFNNRTAKQPNLFSNMKLVQPTNQEVNNQPTSYVMSYSNKQRNTSMQNIMQNI